MRRRLLILALQIACVAAFFAAWEAGGRAGLIDGQIFGTPSQVAAQLVQWTQKGTIQHAAGDTLVAVVIGAGIGILTGWFSALYLALTPRMAAIVEPFTRFLFALPKIALIPLFTLWFGLTLKERVAITAVVVFFFVFYAVYTGARTMPRSMDRVILMMGASFPQRVRILYLPASVGWLFSGLRIAVPYAFAAAVSAEIVAPIAGLGHLVQESATLLNPGGMFGALFVIAALGVTASSLTNGLGRLLPWKL
jgi:NitT/TauT family transport system permease protein